MKTKTLTANSEEQLDELISDFEPDENHYIFDVKFSSSHYASVEYEVETHYESFSAMIVMKFQPPMSIRSSL